MFSFGRSECLARNGAEEHLFNALVTLPKGLSVVLHSEPHMYDNKQKQLVQKVKSNENISGTEE